MSNGHSNAVEHANNYADPEYQQWLDEQDEAAYWHHLNQQIDDYIFQAGRVSRIVDDMTKIAKDNGWKASKKHKYADLVIPF